MTWDGGLVNEPGAAVLVATRRSPWMQEGR